MYTILIIMYTMYNSFSEQHYEVCESVVLEKYPDPIKPSK